MAETTTLTLTDFLLARIADDEADARRRDDRGEQYDSPWHNRDPRRALAECDAKRRIVGIHQPRWDHGGDYTGPFCNMCTPLLTTYPCQTLRHLASVYADHPDYRDDWRP